MWVRSEQNIMGREAQALSVFTLTERCSAQTLLLTDRSLSETPNTPCLLSGPQTVTWQPSCCLDTACLCLFPRDQSDVRKHTQTSIRDDTLHALPPAVRIMIISSLFWVSCQPLFYEQLRIYQIDGRYSSEIWLDEPCVMPLQYLINNNFFNMLGKNHLQPPLTLNFGSIFHKHLKINVLFKV